MWYLDVHTEENIIKNMNRFGYLPKIAEYIGAVSYTHLTLPTICSV